MYHKSNADGCKTTRMILSFFFHRYSSLVLLSSRWWVAFPTSSIAHKLGVEPRHLERQKKVVGIFFQPKHKQRILCNANEGVFLQVGTVNEKSCDSMQTKKELIRSLTSLSLLCKINESTLIIKMKSWRFVHDFVAHLTPGP